MNNKKRVSRAICVFTMLCMGLNASATPVFQPKLEKPSQIVINGVIPDAKEGTRVIAQVFKKGKSLDDLSDTDLSSMRFLGDTVTDANGNYSITFQMNEKDETGDYNYRIISDTIDSGTFHYVNEDDKKEAIGEINEASSSTELGQLIEKNEDVLGIDFEPFTNLDDDRTVVYNEIYARMTAEENPLVFDPAKSSELVTLVRELSLLNCYNLAVEEGLQDENGFVTYTDLLGYDKLDASVREAYENEISETGLDAIFSSLLSQNFSSLEEIREKLNESIMVYYVKYPVVEGYGHIEKWLNDNDGYFDLGNDLETYNDWSENQSKKRVEVDKLLLSEGYTDLETFKEQFGKAITKVKNQKNTNAGGVSNSGNNSSTSKTSGVIYLPASKDTSNTVVTVTPNNSAASGGFEDLQNVEWAREAIEYLSENNLVNGYSQTQFGPENFVTRAEFAKMIVMAAGVYDKAAECTFTDVLPSDWYYSYVASAANEELVKGEGEIFRPLDQITREDMSTILYRTLRVSETQQSDVVFVDGNEISDYAAEAVSYLSSVGIINGMGDGSFAPKANLTRAEAAVALYRMIEFQKNGSVASNNTSQKADAQDDVSKAIDFFEALGVYNSDRFGSDLSATVSKQDLIAYLVELTKMNSYLTKDSAQNHFIDVDESNPNFAAISLFADKDIISVPEDKMFHPNDVIDTNEAIRIMMRFAGYENFETGYDDLSYYVSTASVEGLLDNVELKQQLHVKELIMLLRNLAELDVVTFDINGVNNLHSNKEKGRTLLSMYWDIYKTEGIVTGVPGMGMYRKEVAQGLVYIDEEEYYQEMRDINKYLGFNVDAYYQIGDNASGNELKVLYMEQDEKSEEVTVYAEDIISYENGKLNYYKDKQKKAACTLSSDVTVIYNGQVAESYGNLLTPKNGTVRLIKNSNSSQYSVVIINEFNVCIAGSVVNNNGVYKIYDKFTPENPLQINSDDVEKNTVLLTDKNNQEYAIEQLKEWDVICYYPNLSGEINHYVVINEYIIGSVEGIENADDEIITVSGKEIRLTKDFKVLKNKEIRVGNVGIFYLDIMGDAVAMQHDSTDVMLGWLSKATPVEDGNDKYVTFKIYGEDGKFASYSPAKKMTIDGEPYSMPDEAEKAVAALKDKAEDTKAYEQLIAFKVNAQGEIIYIDTVEKKAKEGNDSLLTFFGIADGSKKQPLTKRYTYEAGTKSFEYKLDTSGKTKIFRVPQSESERNNESMYSVTADSSLTDDKTYTVQAYTFSENSRVADAIVLFESAAGLSNDTRMALVCDISTVVGSQGDAVKQLTLLMNNKEIKIESETLEQFDSVKLGTTGKNYPVKAGDIVRVGYNSNNVCNNIEMVYSLDNDAFGYMSSYTLTGETEPVEVRTNGVVGEEGVNVRNMVNRLTMGYVYSKEDGMFVLSLRDPHNVSELTDKDLENHSTGRYHVYIYDTELKKGELGSASYLLDYMTAREDCSRVVLQDRYTDGRTMVIYK